MSGPGASDIWAHRPPGHAYSGRRTPGGKTRLLIVDGERAYRQSLIIVLELEPDIEIAGEAATGEEAIEAVDRLYPDVVIMDLDLPGMSGLEATRKLCDLYPGILVVNLSVHRGEERRREARRAGASAYVLKDEAAAVLLQTIRDVMIGQLPLLQEEEPEGSAPEQGKQSGTPGRSYGTNYLLTSNERTIMKGLAEGLTNSEIAQRLDVPESMVRIYLAEIYRKLGLSGREAAIKYAREKLKDAPE